MTPKWTPVRRPALNQQTHYPGENLNAGKDSRALWSFQPSGTLVVFVHGWSGGAVETWPHFHELVFDDPTGGFANCDVIFFGYQSVWKSARVGAGLLFNFLHEFLLPQGHLQQRYWSPSVRRSEPISYGKVVLVCHSMGAVVGRLALLTAFERNELWAERCRLVLFAPAHCGADIAELVVAMVSVIAMPLVPITSHFTPGLKELREGSRLITDLAADTRRMLAKQQSSRDALVCKSVLIGDDDKIVCRDRFVDDATADNVPGKDHKEICKPQIGFMKPFMAVVGAL
jgi:pimeloyl-ACP methyl ester carboxylesterase